MRARAVVRERGDATRVIVDAVVAARARARTSTERARGVDDPRSLTSGNGLRDEISIFSPRARRRADGLAAIGDGGENEAVM